MSSSRLERQPGTGAERRSQRLRPARASLAESFEKLSHAFTCHPAHNRLYVEHVTCSAGTQAGLRDWPRGSQHRHLVLGTGVQAPRPHQEENVFSRARRTAGRLDLPAASGASMW